MLIRGVIVLISIIMAIKMGKSAKSPATKLIHIFIWSAVIVLAIYPESAHLLSRLLGIGENLNTLIFLGFILAYIFLAGLVRRIEKIESEISRIVSDDAIRIFAKEKNEKQK